MIDWSESPEWAKWCATDGDGVWWWFGDEPMWEGVEWFAESEFERAFGSHKEDSCPPEKVQRPAPSPAELNTMDCQGGQ